MQKEPFGNPYAGYEAAVIDAEGIAGGEDKDVEDRNVFKAAAV